MNVIKRIVERIKTRNGATRKKCYEENGNKDGTCYGLCGGDRYTECLKYGCIDCKYWRCVQEGQEESDHKFLVEILEQICDYAVDNDMNPTDTVAIAAKIYLCLQKYQTLIIGTGGLKNGRNNM